jgi:hypothetical protein
MENFACQEEFTIFLAAVTVAFLAKEWKTMVLFMHILLYRWELYVNKQLI